MDKIIYNNKTYELAKNTMSIARQIEDTQNSDTVFSAYENELTLCIMALGETNCETILGTLDIENVDLGELVVLYNTIIDGYESKYREFQRKKEAEIMNSQTVRAVKELAENVKAIDGLVK